MPRVFKHKTSRNSFKNSKLDKRRRHKGCKLDRMTKIIFSDATDFQLSKRNKKETITLEQGFNSSISLPNATKNTVSFFTKLFSCNV